MRNLIFGVVFALAITVGGLFATNFGAGTTVPEAEASTCTCTSSGCGFYHPHYRLVMHYDEYGEYGTLEFWYWHYHRCSPSS